MWSNSEKKITPHQHLLLLTYFCCLLIRSLTCYLVLLSGLAIPLPGGLDAVKVYYYTTETLIVNPVAKRHKAVKRPSTDNFLKHETFIKIDYSLTRESKYSTSLITTLWNLPLDNHERSQNGAPVLSNVSLRGSHLIHIWKDRISEDLPEEDSWVPHQPTYDNLDLF